MLAIKLKWRNYTGQDLVNLSNNGVLELDIRFNQAAAGTLFSLEMEIVKIKITEEQPNTQVQLAQRDEEAYGYGFNGMERDDEVSGSGNAYTTEFRGYDPRLGRWKSRDPITHHQFSPYNAFDNNPIFYIDQNGANAGKYITESGETIGDDGNKDDNTYLVNDVGDERTIRMNSELGNTTPHSKLNGDVYQVPSFEERLKFKSGVYDKASSDDSREFSMYSTNNRYGNGFGFVYYKPGPLFERDGSEVRGHADPNSVLSVENDPRSRAILSRG